MQAEGYPNEIAPAACKEGKVGSPQSEGTKLSFPVQTQTNQMELQNWWKLLKGYTVGTKWDAVEKVESMGEN